MINGKEIIPKPLNLKQITELQRDCVSQHRLGYLERIKESLHLMDLDNPRAYMNDLVEKSAQWDVDDLPSRTVYDTSETKLTAELESWAKNKIPGYSPKKSDAIKRRYIAFALDSELLSEEEYLARTNEEVIKIQSGYINWWVTGTPEGMLSMVWHSVKGEGISRDELFESITANQGLFTELSREIESLSAPSVQGNGEDSKKSVTTSPV